MPKGRIGISGPGVFARVYPPILGDEPTSDEQRKLVAVFEIRSAAISELEKRRPDGDVEIDFTILWAYIVRALGTYLLKMRHIERTRKGAVSFNESVLHLASLAKYAVAFFRILRSSVTRANSALRRRISFACAASR